MQLGGKQVTTSIFKSPVNETRAVSNLNIDGDQQSDLTVHGGRNKAIYVYSDSYRALWEQELGVSPLEPSQFGQNLTISDGADDTITIGATYCINNILAVVTQPRIPCFKLGIRMNDATFPNRFWTTGRLGFYLRVEQRGTIATGQTLELVDAPSHGITVRRLYDIVSGGSSDDAAFALDNLPLLDEGWIRRLRRHQLRHQ